MRKSDIHGRHNSERTKMPLLGELIEESLHVKGTLSYQERNIHQKLSTLEELQVGNGAVLKIKVIKR